MLYDIALTLFFVFLNAFFVAAEFAIVRVRAVRLEVLERGGNKLAPVALHIMRRPDAYLSATQLGITVASLGLGWIGATVVASIILNIFAFAGVDMSPELAHSISLPSAFLLITFLHVVFGELGPKSLAIQYPEKVALGVSLPVRIFYILFSPVIWALNSFANIIIRMVGLKLPSEVEEKHTAEELRYIIESGTKSGVITSAEHKLLENIFEFSKTPVRQIMVPRNKIAGIEIGMNVDEILEMIIDEGYSRLPVYDKTIDNIVGIIYAKDVISLMMHRNLIIMQDLIRPAYFVRETDLISRLLGTLQKRKLQFAVVLDDFGGTAGIVTMEDILEEIVGEIQDEYDEELPIVQKPGKDEFLIDAQSPIADVNEFLPAPLPESDDYETTGGLLTAEVGRIPEVNEVIELEDYFCRIVKRSERSIEVVRLKFKVNEEE
ncbi:MAG: hemolysin family protein [Candidatus Kapaibacterium sp.]